MHFIKDDQLEGVTHLSDEVTSGVIRCHGKRLDVFLPTIVHADCRLKGID